MASGAELSQRHYPWQITTLPLWSGYGALGGALENVAAPCPFSAQRGIAWGDLGGGAVADPWPDSQRRHSNPAAPGGGGG